MSENKAIKGISGDSQMAIDTNQLQEGLGTQPAQYLISRVLFFPSSVELEPGSTRICTQGRTMMLYKHPKQRAVAPWSCGTM